MGKTFPECKKRKKEKRERQKSHTHTKRTMDLFIKYI